jgi:hypothetical protein
LSADLRSRCVLLSSPTSPSPSELDVNRPSSQQLGIEIDGEPTYPYTPSHATFVPPPEPEPYPEPDPVPAPTKSSAFKPFRAPGAAKAVNPLATAVEARRSVTPGPSAPPPASIKSSAFFLPTVVPQSKIVPFSEGGKGVVRKPVPKFDPKAKGAVVMRRPDEEHEKEYNRKKCVPFLTSFLHSLPHSSLARPVPFTDENRSHCLASPPFLARRKLPVVDVVIDPLLGDKLRDHQKDGVKFLYEVRPYSLFSPPPTYTDRPSFLAVRDGHAHRWSRVHPRRRHGSRKDDSGHHADLDAPQFVFPFLFPFPPAKLILFLLQSKTPTSATASALFNVP